MSAAAALLLIAALARGESVAQDPDGFAFEPSSLLIEAVGRDPADAESLRRLHALASSSHARYEAVVGPLVKPLARGERRKVLDDSYRLLLSPYPFDLRPQTLGAAVADYRAGRLLKSWAGLRLLSGLGPGGDWIEVHARSYREDRIPAALDAKLRGMPEAAGAAYRAAFDALRASDWGACADILESPESGAFFSPAELAELRALRPWVLRRLDGSRLGARALRRRLREGLAEAERRPAKALSLLEPVIYEAGRLRRVEAFQARDAFSRAYERLRIQRTAGEAG